MVVEHDVGIWFESVNKYTNEQPCEQQEICLNGWDFGDYIRTEWILTAD